MIKMPNDETGKALIQIAQDGSDLSKPMEIDFFIAVTNKKNGDVIATKANALGFLSSVEIDEETGDWTCYCTKSLIPDYTKVVEIEEQLDHIAKLSNGYIDGFGSYGNAVLKVTKD